MSNNIVIITGAGFSAPAKLPLQNEILREMSAHPANSIMNFEVEIESVKFLHAYIEVAIYLLAKYSDRKYNDLYTKYDLLNEAFSVYKIVTRQHKDSTDIIQKILEEDEVLFAINEDKYYSELIILKEDIRKMLELSNLEINLEDIFTLFDKSILSHEYLGEYSYGRIDRIRQSIMRLFIYYFGRKSQDCSLQIADYVEFINFLKKYKDGVSIITTNWDTLLERYCKSYNISYDLSLNDTYFKFDDARKNSVTKKKSNKLIKIHGSINWLNCLNCGNISIFEKSSNRNYLLDDNSKEICLSCGAESQNNDILLQPEIITPTMIKSIDSQLYKNLWRAAGNELANADKLIFIGYSFPVADYEFRNLLQKSVSHSTSIDVVLHTNDNPNKIPKRQKHLKSLLPEKRYRDAFNQNEIRFFYDGFKQYFENYSN